MQDRVRNEILGLVARGGVVYNIRHGDWAKWNIERSKEASHAARRQRFGTTGQCGPPGRVDAGGKARLDEDDLESEVFGLADRVSRRVAAVIVDGGRMQVRDERWGTPKEPGERRNWWREPKIGCVTTFQSREQAEDPLPEIPACLLDPLFVIPRVLEMKRTRAGTGGEENSSVPAQTLASAVPPSKPERWSPPPLVQSVVGTLGSYEDLGRLVEVEAWHRGFAGAPRKVFLGDGLPANWRMQRERFSHYLPVVDLMHAIAYVYTAAIESSSERYDEYRRRGLPITTALGESKMKPINRRMKGTEKFWREGGEPQLQLCCDSLSDTAPLKGFWRRRAAGQRGLRKSRSST